MSSPSRTSSHDAGPATNGKVHEPSLAPADRPTPAPIPSTPTSPVFPSSSSASISSLNGSARKPAMKREYSGQNGPLYMQASNNVVLVRRRKRKNEGPIKQFTRWFVENQVGLSFNVLALLLLAHVCMPKARVHTSKFFNISYYNPSTGLYGVGKDDGYFITFCIVLLTGLRAFTMENIIAPFAKAQGVNSRKAIVRFSEQGWLLIYCSIFWSLGLYIYATSPQFMNLSELWTNWPNRECDGIMKAYILGQLSFWMQQILVINIEERRKDHWQMFSHHIVTVALVYGAYRYHFTKVANLILCLMDIVDLFLPTAKCLKYLGYTTICDWMFGLFMLSWVAARHVGYNMAVWSVWVHTPNLFVGYYKGPATNVTGPYPLPEKITLAQSLSPLWNSDGMIYFSESTQWTFLSMLLFLQGLTIVWFTMIVRVAIKVIRGDGAEDSRSDDEAEEDEEDEFVYEEAQPLEEEVGVEQLDLKSWERRTGVKRQAAAASGVSIPGHSDRKELLGRIGCEKQVD